MTPATEIVRGIRPALATLGGPLIALSSPYARKGVLWTTYHKHFGGKGKVLVAQAPSLEMNPTLPKEIIKDAYEDDHAAAMAESGAQFRRDIESFTNIESVEAIVAEGITERYPTSGQIYYGFVDPSGGSKDAFTLAIGHKERDTAVLDCIREVRPPFSPEGVVYDFSETLKRYSVSKVVGDRYAGDWPKEQFRKYGITYDQSAAPKSYLYQNLLPVINSQTVSLLDNTRLIDQLVSLERKTSSTKDRIDHPPNGHDDVANAVAGVVSIMTSKPHHEAGRFVLRI